MDLSRFGKYKTVNVEDENIKMKDLEKLSSLIFTTSSSWGETMLSKIVRERNNNTFAGFLNEGYFKIYIYEYEVPQKPQSELDESILMLLKEWGKYKSLQLERLYWFSDRTLNKLGFNMIKMNSMFKDFRLVNSSDDDFIPGNLDNFKPFDYIKYRYSKQNDLYRNDLQVYCGTFDLERLMGEVEQGINYFIIFPFRYDVMDLEQGDKSQFYLLEKTEKYK